MNKKFNFLACLACFLLIASVCMAGNNYLNRAILIILCVNFSQTIVIILLMNRVYIGEVDKINLLIREKIADMRNNMDISCYNRIS